MDEIKLETNEKGRQAFHIETDGVRLGEMQIGISGNLLTVYHTEVSPKAEGKGLAKKLLAAMVDHARTNQLKVVPLCPYVLVQFKRNPSEYGDVWMKD